MLKHIYMYMCVRDMLPCLLPGDVDHEDIRLPFDVGALLTSSPRGAALALVAFDLLHPEATERALQGFCMSNTIYYIILKHIIILYIII